MHLVRGMSSLNTKKRRQKKSPGWKQKMAEHDKFLRKMGAHPDQLAKKKEKNANISILSHPDYSTNRTGLPTSDIVPGGSTAPKERQIYSGERTLLGVAVMHKSNMVPVFADKKEDAIDIAQMRRN